MRAFPYDHESDGIGDGDGWKPCGAEADMPAHYVDKIMHYDEQGELWHELGRSHYRDHNLGPADRSFARARNYKSYADAMTSEFDFGIPVDELYA